MAWDLIGSDVPAYSSAMMIGMLRHTPTDVGVTPQSSPIQCGPLLGDETLAAFVAAFDYRPAESGQHHVDEVLSPIIFPRSQGHTSSMLQDLQAGRRT